MKYLCKKCKKYTEHEEIETTVKAGDSGTVKTTGFKCKECGFVPLFLGEPEKRREEKRREEKRREKWVQLDLCDIC